MTTILQTSGFGRIKILCFPLPAVRLPGTPENYIPAVRSGEKFAGLSLSSLPKRNPTTQISLILYSLQANLPFSSSISAELNPRLVILFRVALYNGIMVVVHVVTFVKPSKNIIS